MRGFTPLWRSLSQQWRRFIVLSLPAAGRQSEESLLIFLARVAIQQYRINSAHRDFF